MRARSPSSNSRATDLDQTARIAGCIRTLARMDPILTSPSLELRAAMGILIQLIGAMAAAFASGWAVASEAQVEVDANLVTALDVSYSVGRYEEFVEREGLAHALVHPQFLEAVRSGPQRRIGF